MAVMLRTLGIPSRIVNGFRTGEFNDLTSQYLVRASNAHSWVEAYFPGYGWISFDPTPAAPVAAPTGWSRVMMYVDAMASFWREWVVSYDVSHQRTLGEEAARGTRQWLDAVRNWWRQHYQALLGAVRRTQECDGTETRAMERRRSLNYSDALVGGQRTAIVASISPGPIGGTSGEISPSGCHHLVREDDARDRPSRLD